MIVGNPGPIGIFDSGVGGLTVAREVFRQLPEEEVLYFGDTAHLPYGPRPPAELIAFADAITSFLAGQGAKVVLDACNSTSSVAIGYLQEKYPSLPVLGVVEPGVEEALRVTRNGRIGVIATEATVESGAHCRAARRLDPAVQVFAQACPSLVPLVEAGKVRGPAVERAAREYLGALQARGIDTLILGCTHYPYLAPLLREILGPGVTLVDPANQMVGSLAELLRAAGWRRPGPQPPAHRFYVSSSPLTFVQVGEKLLGRPGLLGTTRLAALE